MLEPFSRAGFFEGQSGGTEVLLGLWGHWVGSSSGASQPGRPRPLEQGDLGFFAYLGAKSKCKLSGCWRWSGIGCSCGCGVSSGLVENAACVPDSS